jgi:hypothetical protein
MSLASPLETYKIPYSNPVRKPTQHKQLLASHSSIQKALLRFSRFLKGSKAVTRHNSIRNLCQRKSQRKSLRIVSSCLIPYITQRSYKHRNCMSLVTEAGDFFLLCGKISCESTPIIITLGFYSLPTTTQETQHAKH